MKSTNNSQKPVLLERILRWSVYATAFVPLIIFSQFISPFHFGKIIVFRSYIDILFVLYLVLLIRYGKAYFPPRTKLFWSISAFTLAFGLTTLTSASIFQSFWGTFERMGGWFSFVHFWILFVILSSVIRSKKQWLFYLNLSLFVSLLSSFYGFLQKTDISWIIGSGGRTKIFGTIGNPALFAGYIIVNTFLALTMLFQDVKKLWRYFYFSVFILNALAILLTGVRGSVLGLIVGVLVFGILYGFNLSSRKVKFITWTFFAVVVVFGGLIISLRNSDFVKKSQYLNRYSDFSLSTYTVQTRFWAWRAGFDGLNDSFKAMTFGYGPENFNIPFSKHFNPKFFRGLGSETLFDRAHNQFIEILITMGLVGFLSYMSIFFFAIKRLFQFKNLAYEQGGSRELKIFGIGIFATLLAYSIHNFFIFDTSANYLVFFLVLGLLNFLSIESGIETKNYFQRIIVQPVKAGKLMFSNIAGTLLMVFVLFLIWNTNIKPAKANYTTTRAIVASWNGNHDLAFEKFKEALSYDTFGKYEIRHRYAQYILERANRLKVDAKIREQLSVAIENVKKNLSFGDDYLPYLYISRSYILLGRDDPNSEYNDLALENSMKALEVSPTFVRTFYEIAQVYLNKKDYNKAVEYFQKASDLNPEVGLTHWYLAVTYFEKGDLESGFKEVQAARETAYDFTEQDLLKLINTYIKVGNLEEIVLFYKRLVELNPKNPQYWASFAATYARLGQIDEAVNAAHKAAEVDSQFEPEAKAFVQSLGRQW